MKYILITLLLFFVFLSCQEDQFKSNKCNNIDCSNHGECYVDNNYYTRCNCDSGYYEQGYNCLEYSCKEGYELNGTNCIKTCQDCQGEDTYTSDPCENQECSNHGFCKSDPDRTIYCNCYLGYKLEGGLSCIESLCDGTSCATQ
jgi:hypothetical protein